MKALALAAAFLAIPAMAQPCPECPAPKRLTCEELKARVVDRCEPEPPIIKIVDRQVPVPVPCDPCPEAKTVTKVETKTEYVPMLTPQPNPPSGSWLLGGGPIYQHGLGATVVTGYRWTNGWELLVGPTWIPQDGTPEYKGVAVKGCVKIPYTVPAGADPHPWGAQALVVHAF